MRKYFFIMIVLVTVLQSCSYDYIYPEISVYRYWIHFSTYRVISEMERLGKQLKQTESYIEEISDSGEVVAKKRNCLSDSDWIITSPGVHKVLPVVNAYDKNGLVLSLHYDTLYVENIFLQRIYLDNSSKQTIYIY